MSDSKHETELRRANRALRMLSDSNQSVIRATDEQSLLNEVCRIAVVVGGYRMAWVGFAEQAAKVIRPVARIGPPAPYLMTGGLSWAEGQIENAPAASAIREGRAVFVSDLETHPGYETWREAARRCGYRAAVALPLVADGRTLGVLSIYASEAGELDEREMQILNELAGDVAYGINALRIREERDRAMAEVRRQARMMEAFFQQAVSSFVLFDRDYNFVRVNEAFARFYGRKPEDFVGQPAHFLYPELQALPPEHKELLDRVVQTRMPVHQVAAPYVSPVALRREVMYWDSTLQPILDEKGEVAFLVFTAQDVSARVRAQRSLQQVLRHARTTVMQAEVVVPQGWREHETEWVAREMKWTARFDDEMAAQDVMPLSLATGETYYDGWVRAKVRDDWRPMAMTAARAFVSDAPSWQQEFRAVDRDGRTHWFAQVASITSVGENRWHVTTINTDVTERRSAEDALHAREEQFVALAENSPDVIARLDRAGRYLYVNCAIERLTGIPAALYLGRQIGEPLAEREKLEVDAGLMAVRAAVAQVVEQGVAQEREMALSLRGQERVFDTWLVPERDPSGATASVLCVARDVTAHRRAEEALAAREREFRALAENTPDFIVRWDRALQRVYVNPAFAQATGRRPEELIAQDYGTNYREELYAGSAAGIEQIGAKIRQVFAEAAAAELEVQWVTMTGRRYYYIRFVPEFDGRGVLQTVLGIGRDVTALKEKEQQLRALADNSPDFIGRYDREHRALYVNRAVEKLVGMSAERIVGRRIGDLSRERNSGIGAAEKEALVRAINKVFETAEALETDIDLRSAEREMIVNVRMVPETDETGHVASVLTIARNVTALRRAEQERQAHLRFFECMDRVNRALQGTNDLERMMRDVLDVVLELFACDRAWLVYPCDPDAAEWRVPMERTRPEYRGAFAAGSTMPMEPDAAVVMQKLLAARGPVQFGPDTENPVPASAREYQVQSFIASAVYPKVDKPFIFGLHQCSHARVWRPEEETLLREIGRRLADVLSTLLTMRSLRESERRLDAAQHIAHVGYWDRDLATNRITWSDETYRIFGLQPQGGFITFATLQERIHPDDRKRMSTALAEALQAGSRYNVEYRTIRPDGDVRVVHSQGDVVRNEAGQPSRMFGTVQDITDRKRTQEALALFRSLIDHATDCIEVIDPATARFLDVNEKACLVHGYTREEYLALTVPAVDPLVKQEDWAGIVASIQSTGSRAIQTQHRRKDGSIFPVEVNATFIRLDRDYLLAVVRDVTERQRAEEALRESQVRLELATRATQIGPWDWNLVTNEVHFSTEWKRQLGYEEHEISNHYLEWETRLHPDDRERVLAELSAYHAGQRPAYEVEFRMRHKDGSYRWIFTRGEVMRDGQGTPVRMIGCHLDLTARKQAQEELRQSQQAYAALVNTVDGIVWEVDVPTFRFTFVSQQAERLLGYPVERWLNEPEFWQTHVHPEDRSWALNYCVTATNEKRDHDFRYRMLAADGRVVWLHDVVTVVVENARPAKLRGIMVDITAEKAAEEALRWRTALFEAQVDSGLDGILVVDEHGKKILQNRRLAELWKIPPHIANDPDDGPQFSFVTGQTKNSQEFIEKVAYLYAHREEVSRDEVVLVDGTVLDRYSAPVRDQGGKYYGRIWTFRDITATRKLEEQFRQSQKMDAVGQLAGGIAHDFNNLLTVIQMQASMLLADPSTAREVGTSVHQIMSAAQRAAILTRQLLTFSRREAKQARTLDLSEVIGNMAKLVRRILGEDVSLETRFASGLPAVLADPGMMEQVLMNLLVNARDAMPEGGQVVIALEALRLDAEYVAAHGSARVGHFVCLTVSDTGQGISPENLPRIFEPFFTTKEVGKGTGLGLATVFGIVQEHQGWIEVMSTVGHGTTFRIFLPAVPRETDRATASAPVSAVHGGSETILLVEDDSVVRALAAATLQRHGYRLHEAATGREALQRWEALGGKIDLLLTDMIMPGGVSGQRLATELRQRSPSLKVIYTSGYPDRAMSDKITLETGRNFLPKPYPIADLATIVRRRLDEG